MHPHDPAAVAVIKAIHTGDLEMLKRLLSEDPGLATARIGVDEGGDRECEADGKCRTLLHIATDWPGHFPNGAATVTALTGAGAAVNARFIGPHSSETPLHWAASSDDVEVLDALLDSGADIEAPGAVIAGGTALDDAVAFGQWRAAHRLVDRGAQTALWHAAALGLMDRIEQHFASGMPPARHPWGDRTAYPNEVTIAFWCACHGGQRQSAEYLIDRGAERNWVSVWDGLTPLDAARRAGVDELVEWLRGRGATSAKPN